MTLIVLQVLSGNPCACLPLTHKKIYVSRYIAMIKSKKAIGCFNAAPVISLPLSSLQRNYLLYTNKGYTVRVKGMGIKVWPLT